MRAKRSLGDKRSGGLRANPAITSDRFSIISASESNNVELSGVGLLTQSLLFFVLLGVYTNFAISIAGARFAGGLAFVFGFMLALRLTFGPLGSSVKSGLLPIIGLCVAWSMSIPFSPGGLGFLFEHVKSLILLGGSIFVSWVVFVVLVDMGRDRVKSIFKVLSIGLLVLSALEPYTPLKEFSDRVRELIYADSFLYSSELRDLQISGIVRPMLFTQEPSHLAKFMSFSILAWWVLDRRPTSLLFGTAVFGLAVAVTGSPTVVLVWGIFLVCHFFGLLDRVFGAKFVFFSLSLKLLTATLIFIAYINLPLVASFLPGSRAEAVASNSDTSSLIRTTGAFQTAFETILQYPISGAGIGGRELVQDILLSVFSQFPGVFIRRFVEGVGYVGWGNAFAEMLVYGGLLIGSIIYCVQFVALRIFVRDVSMLLTVFFITMNADSGFVSPRVWVYFGIVSAAIRLRGGLEREVTS